MAKTRTTFLTEGVSGRVGNLLFVQGTQGTYLRSIPGPRIGRISDAEREGQRLTERVALYWSRLDPEAMGWWRAYAQARTAARPAEERTVTNGWNEYFALGKKLLQIDPARALPTEPPTGRFVGDLVQFGVEAFPEKGETPTLPSPLGEEIGVAFVANRANEPGVLTELLVQHLANGGRLPTARGYRSQGFLAFEEAGTAEVPTFPGWYACATRFVEATTGRATDLVPCGVVRVGL